MKDNIQLQNLIVELKKQSALQKVNLWGRLAYDLAKPTRSERIVNLYKIDKYAQGDETIIVPGKVLGTGEITRQLSIAAFRFSEQALEKLRQSKCTVMSIQELMQKNPTGKKVRIIG